MEWTGIRWARGLAASRGPGFHFSHLLLSLVGSPSRGAIAQGYEARTCLVNCRVLSKHGRGFGPSQPQWSAPLNGSAVEANSPPGQLEGSGRASEQCSPRCKG